jgi:hypothetical protein
MSALPPFNLLKQKLSVVTVNGQLKVNNTYDEFLDIVRSLLRATTFDSAWYVAEYPDLAEALANGEITSPKDHFIDSGYFEGRLPGPLKVDTAWYLEKYPDVAEGIERGDIESAEQHFTEHGYWEGRAPSAD